MAGDYTVAGTCLSLIVCVANPSEPKPAVTILCDAQGEGKHGTLIERIVELVDGTSHSRADCGLNDSYRTLRQRTEFRQKIERSDFLGIAFPVAEETAVFAELDRIAKRHFDATHHCWAFRLFQGERARSADAGEPAGTAGRPILSAIESASLFDTAIVVVRWFGGVKLGTGGLSRAYRETAAQTLQRAEIVERYLYDRLRVIVPYERISDAYRLVDPPSVVLAGEQFGETNEFSYDVRRSRREEFAAAVAARRLTLR